MDSITGRPLPTRTKDIHIGPYTAMGEHLPATIYLPVNSNGTTRSLLGKAAYPLIIYLHQYAYAHGYAYGYNPHGGGKGSQKAIQKLTDRGFAVMAIDMFGFGTRLREAQHFYDRQPGWSKMGKMVTDVSACVDAAQELSYLDASNVFVFGDTIGGVVGLMAAARDTRIAGVAAVAAVSPWRASNEQYPTLRTLAIDHAFMPRLGMFVQKPEASPVDFGEIIASIAPRPVMITAPTLDRHSDPDATKFALANVEKVYRVLDAKRNFQVDLPEEINRVMPGMEDHILDFFQRHLERDGHGSAADNQAVLLTR